MTVNVIPKANYFLVGVGIGSLIALFAAPKSGKQTREYLVKKAREGKKYARAMAEEFRARAEETVEAGIQEIAETKSQIAAAIDVGRDTYEREKWKGQVV